ncbi:MAG: hypothetical protein HY236_06855, partial [Acidobacteria bacterium]|nr:hypothetical protein [Acidobacteriota bacterium]
PQGNSSSRGAYWLSAGLLYLLSFQSSAATAPLQAQAGAAPKLTIVVLGGEGAINNLRQRTAREPIVQVLDEDQRPVVGAVVMFTLPDRGAGGSFPNGTTRLAATTDAHGQAIATGLRPNGVAGKFQIRVDASSHGQRASATINQSNVLTAAAARPASGKLVAILAIAGGAAAGGAVAAARGGGKAAPPTSPPPNPTPTTVGAGTPSIGPPR